MTKKVALIGGFRTPFVKAQTAFKDKTALELGSSIVTNTTKALDLKDKVEELAFGSVLLDPRTPNLAREIILRGEFSKNINAHFVSNNCITGLVASNFISEAILSGRITCGLAGGVESMSTPTLTFSRSAEKFWMNLSRAKSFGEKLKGVAGYRPRFLVPIPPSPKEPSTGLTMGEHCELMAKEWGIKREDQDRIAAMSHVHADAAKRAGFLAGQIESTFGIAEDNLVRGDTSLDKLAKLKPVFDKSASGTLTAGNSSALTDGASCVALMEYEAAKANGYQNLVTIEGHEFASVDPKEGLLMAPVIAVAKLLKRLNLTFNEIDIFEVHEAFAAQVLCNLKAWRSGWKNYSEIGKLGEIPEEKLNVNGGSVALGHPFAATGGRLLLSAAQSLKARDKELTLISVCAAGGMGCAVVVRRSL